MSGINFEAMSKDVKMVSGLVHILLSTEPIKMSTRLGVVEVEIEDRSDIDDHLLKLLKASVRTLSVYVS